MSWQCRASNEITTKINCFTGWEVSQAWNLSRRSWKNWLAFKVYEWNHRSSENWLGMFSCCRTTKTKYENVLKTTWNVPNSYRSRLKMLKYSHKFSQVQKPTSNSIFPRRKGWKADKEFPRIKKLHIQPPEN